MAVHFTTKKNGVKVYNKAESQYDQAAQLEQKIRNQMDQVSKDPNLSPRERKHLLKGLQKSLENARAAKDACSTTKRGGVEDSKYDLNFDFINSHIQESERQLIAITGNYTDALQGSQVDEPPRYFLATDSKKTDSTTTENTTIGTQPTDNTGHLTLEQMSNMSEAELSAHFATGNNANQIKNMDPSELRTIAKTNPELFGRILDALPDKDALDVQRNIQEHLQSMNRMFALISNINQAMHDTQKALINNIRV